MKALCPKCHALRDIDYPTSQYEDGGFTITGRCATCGASVEQKKVLLA